ncbi:MAG: xanthine dehydrogenase accessory protein XdhC [Phycisphaerales bacterium]|nr:xanthine dehydrogenase accessory protein XdhC [Planctomycetota bacterium]
MDETSHILRAAAELSEAGEEFVLLTVIRTQGSTPREVGARMIWRPPSAFPAVESLAFPNGAFGTIGGGQFEDLALEAAKECARRKCSMTERFVLGAEAEQCCGGVMEVFVEYHPRRATVMIFGAGHVAQALFNILSPTPLRIAIVDDRPEWNSEPRFPSARRFSEFETGIEHAVKAADATMALVMTCSHETDFKVLRGLLQSTPPAFVGLIGSRSKRACLFGRLSAEGIPQEFVQRVHCPIGVGQTGKDPQSVAISIAAQLLLEARALAAAATGARRP